MLRMAVQVHVAGGLSATTLWWTVGGNPGRTFLLSATLFSLCSIPVYKRWTRLLGTTSSVDRRASVLARVTLQAFQLYLAACKSSALGACANLLYLGY